MPLRNSPHPKPSDSIDVPPLLSIVFFDIIEAIFNVFPELLLSFCQCIETTIIRIISTIGLLRRLLPDRPRRCIYKRLASLAHRERQQKLKGNQLHFNHYHFLFFDTMSSCLLALSTILLRPSGTQVLNRRERNGVKRRSCIEIEDTLLQGQITSNTLRYIEILPRKEEQASLCCRVFFFIEITVPYF